MLLQVVLDEVLAGGMVCSVATRHRLEGAVLALDAAAGTGLARVAPEAPEDSPG